MKKEPDARNHTLSERSGMSNPIEMEISRCLGAGGGGGLLGRDGGVITVGFGVSVRGDGNVKLMVVIVAKPYERTDKKKKKNPP